MADEPNNPIRDDEPVIDLTSDDYFMGEAIRQATKAFEIEEVPIGCIIVHGGHIVARAYNQVEMLKDATAHAEMLAITQAEAALGDWRLNACTLYVTKEPCPMCAGAIVNSRVGRVVFGVKDDKAGSTGSVFNIVQHATLNHKADVLGGVKAQESLNLLQEFFRLQRLKKPEERK
jgi:tRNA(adenine34) deaminase